MPKYRSLENKIQVRELTTMLLILVVLLNVGDIMGQRKIFGDLLFSLTKNKDDTYNFPFVSRSEWSSRKPLDFLPLPVPVPFVVIHHSYLPRSCSNKIECKRAMRDLQERDMIENGWWDIGYNFAVGGDGAVYEGRGWTRLGAHALLFSNVSMGICVIGDWRNQLPPKGQLQATRALIAAGVKLGFIKRDYKLVGHRQVRATECPGDALFNEIQTWARFSPTIDLYEEEKNDNILDDV